MKNCILPQLLLEKDTAQQATLNEIPELIPVQS